jgi:hypothetical protein
MTIPFSIFYCMPVRLCFCSSIGSSKGILYDAVAKFHILICRDLQESSFSGSRLARVVDRREETNLDLFEFY